VKEAEISTADSQLARGVLTTVDAVAVSVTVLAPGMAMLLNVPAVAAVAGGSTPLAFLIGGIACLALAFVVAGFARRMASAGYAYTYASRTLGKSAGFVAGWSYGFAVLCFVPMTMAAVSYLVCDLLRLDIRWWFPVFAVGMVLLVVLAIAHVRITTRLQLAVGLATVVVILIVNMVVTAKGGAHGNSLEPFTFSHTEKGGFSGVFYGIILGVTSYIGFETAADFGEETSRPRRSIPVAVVVSVALAIVFYMWTTYSLTIGFGVSSGAAFGGDHFALKTIADRYLNGVFGTLVEVGALLSAFIVCVGCVTAATRTLYAMGREGALPRWLGVVHARFKTPVNATVTSAVLATVLAAAVGFGVDPGALGARPNTVYYFFATLGTLAIIIVYIGLCVGGAVFFRRTHPRYRPLLHLGIPAVGILIFGAALYGSVYPVPVYPLNTTPYLALTWVMLGLVVVGTMRTRRPAAVKRIGSIVGEEDA
jgi:amino acid transporter